MLRPFDLQVNGYAGTDFCSANLTAEELHSACQALQEDGVDGILATLITDSIPNLVAKLTNLVQLRAQDPLAERLISGFHIEGPFLNPNPGFIGAHPPEAVTKANREDAKRLLDAGDGLIRLITLAPESDPKFRTIRFLADHHITVSAGHCDPSLDQLQGAIDNGLSMITHFGNACPVQLPRHENILQRMLHLRDRLWFCFIPDGVHLPFFALQNYLDLIGLDRSIMVTDAISAAKLGPGTHLISGLEVEVDASGVARRPGSPNLAGSTVTMPRIQENLAENFGFGDDQIRLLIDSNPRTALKQP